MQTRSMLATLILAVTAMAVEFDPGGFSVTISPTPLGKPTAAERDVAIRAFPHAFMDDRVVLSQHQPGLLLLAFTRLSEAKLGTLTAHLELPRTVEVLGVGDGRLAVQRTELGDRVHVAIDATPTVGSITAKGYNAFGALPVVLRTAAAPGTAAAATYWLTHGQEDGPRRSLALGVMPRIEGLRPRRFETGVHFTGNCIRLSSPAVEEWARFYAETGANAAMIEPGAFSQYLRQMKILRYHQPGWLVNGHMIGTTPRPESVLMVQADGSTLPNGVCPAVIYQREEPYVSEHLVAPLRKILVEDRDTDHFLCNWEPFMFDFKGCFCGRCRAEFARYASFTEEQMAAVWPGQVIARHRDLWIEFRAWQGARLIQTLEAIVSTLGREIGREAHFAPEVHIKSITPLWTTSDSLRQYATMAYAGTIPLLNAWGPYPWQTVMMPYHYVRGYNLSTHCLTRDSVDYLRAELPAERRPRLLGFPHGLQGNLWTTEPESMAMDILTYYVNGYDGQLVYAFPKGYDARYWKALADANTAIATFEDMVLDGDTQRRHQIEPLTPYPRPSPRFLDAPCGGIDKERWAEASMLQSWEFTLGRRRLVAVANYWQRGECFARLSVPGLDAAAPYRLSEPLARRVFGSDDGAPALAGAALERGAVVHVGAQRMAFFLVEPADDAPRAEVVLRPAEVEAARQSRQAAIAAAAAAEPTERSLADYAKAFARVGRVEAAGVVSERVADPDLKRDVLRLTAPAQAVTIDVLGGGRVRSWRVGGVELVSPDKEGGLALDGFWQPAALVTGPMELLRQDPAEGRLSVVLQRSDLPGLPGLELTKTLDIEAAAATIRVRSHLRHRGETAVEFSHRYHNLPAFLERPQGQLGRATFAGDPAGAYSRAGRRHMAIVAGGAPDVLLTKAFDMAQTSTVKTATPVDFEAPWLSVRARVDLAGTPVHSVVFWDSQAMPCATFEPIHPRVTLATGQEWSTGMTWTATPR
ncbi:MAG: hypothetical protein GX595_10790 [Lentisphaerae bacterium]|nr:hypothetical protein [Lentisphaerota bacterium]